MTRKILVLLGLVAGICYVNSEIIEITIDAAGNEIEDTQPVDETVGNDCEVDTECGTLCCFDAKC